MAEKNNIHQPVIINPALKPVIDARLNEWKEFCVKNNFVPLMLVAVNDKGSAILLSDPNAPTMPKISTMIKLAGSLADQEMLKQIQVQIDGPGDNKETVPLKFPGS